MCYAKCCDDMSACVVLYLELCISAITGICQRSNQHQHQHTHTRTKPNGRKQENDVIKFSLFFFSFCLIFLLKLTFIIDWMLSTFCSGISFSFAASMTTSTSVAVAVKLWMFCLSPWLHIRKLRNIYRVPFSCDGKKYCCHFIIGRIRRMNSFALEDGPSGMCKLMLLSLHCGCSVSYGTQISCRSYTTDIPFAC